MKIQEAINLIEDSIINEEIGEIKFTIALDEIEVSESGFLVDVSILDRKGYEIYGDLNFETFEILDYGNTAQGQKLFKERFNDLVKKGYVVWELKTIETKDYQLLHAILISEKVPVA